MKKIINKPEDFVDEMLSGILKAHSDDLKKADQSLREIVRKDAPVEKKVAIATGEVENVRNAPYHAGFAASYGLGKQEGLKAITINAAEIFGVSDKLGSIEEGKQANLFIADGDPFEPMNHITDVFIRGNKIPMVSRHIQLYQQYLDRGAKTK